MATTFEKRVILLLEDILSRTAGTAERIAALEARVEEIAFELDVDEPIDIDDPDEDLLMARRVQSTYYARPNGRPWSGYLRTSRVVQRWLRRDVMSTGAIHWAVVSRSGRIAVPLLRPGDLDYRTDEWTAIERVEVPYPGFTPPHRPNWQGLALPQGF